MFGGEMSAVNWFHTETKLSPCSRSMQAGSSIRTSASVRTFWSRPSRSIERAGATSSVPAPDLREPGAVAKGRLRVEKVGLRDGLTLGGNFVSYEGRIDAGRSQGQRRWLNVGWCGRGSGVRREDRGLRAVRLRGRSSAAAPDVEGIRPTSPRKARRATSLRADLFLTVGPSCSSESAPRSGATSARATTRRCDGGSAWPAAATTRTTGVVRCRRLPLGRGGCRRLRRLAADACGAAAAPRREPEPALPAPPPPLRRFRTRRCRTHRRSGPPCRPSTARAPDMRRNGGLGQRVDLRRDFFTMSAKAEAPGSERG